MSTQEHFDRATALAVTNFLKSNVRKSDIPNVETELKKDFILAKIKSKVQKPKKPKKKKPRAGLTRKEKKKLGYYCLPRNSVRYNDVLPMKNMWTEYMTQLLELEKPVPEPTSKGWENFIQTIYKSDFHGSLLHIVRSKCPTFVGKNGICIMDTRNTFRIVSRDNISTTIPKKENVFEMHLKHLKITLFGKHLCVRPAERSTKKVKGHLHPDL